MSESDEVKALFPVTFEAQIYLTDDNGQTAKATYDLPPGQLPSKEKIQEIVAKVAEEVPGDFRPMDKREFIEAVLYEMTGERMAAAVGREFDE